MLCVWGPGVSGRATGGAAFCEAAMCALVDEDEQEHDGDKKDADDYNCLDVDAVLVVEVGVDLGDDAHDFDRARARVFRTHLCGNLSEGSVSKKNDFVYI